MDRQTNGTDSETGAENIDEIDIPILDAEDADVAETQTANADAGEVHRPVDADVEETHSLVDADVGEMNSLVNEDVRKTKGILENADAGRKQVESLENGGLGVSLESEPVKDQTPQTISDVPVQHHDDTEEDRYEHVREVAATGNGLKLERLLGDWEEKEWLRDWRNEENLTLYVDAVTDGYLDVINALLAYDLPLGDAILRAIDVEFDEAIKAICHYLQTCEEDVCELTLKATCDNDDFHPSITPLILAAQRNNFDVVKLLIDLGAKIQEPSMSLGSDVTLTKAISTLHVYRALSQPAYILSTQTDVFGHAFELSARLKTLSRMWEDFGARYEEMARGVEVFAGEMLGQSASTEEILALFRYHNTDKYRDSKGKQHPLAKLFEAIDYQQKEFIAHPHSQKAIIVQFYRNLLDWNERGVLYQILLTLFVLFGYPIICLLYKLLPFQSVVNFARQPYIMMLMKAGSGFTFLAFITAVTVIDKSRYPGTVEALNVLILLWVLGLVWLHLKIIRKHGLRKYTSDSMNIHEAVIAILCISVVCLYWAGNAKTLQGAELNRDKPLDVRVLLTSTKNLFTGKLNETTIESLNGVLEKALSNCHIRGTADSRSGVEISSGLKSLPLSLRETMEHDQYEPTVVAGALFGVTVTVSVLRMLNLFLVSEAVGPLRISLGEMVSDIVKFCCIFVVIWFAFAIGLSQNFYSAGRSATKVCLSEGSDPGDCQDPVGFSTFFASVRDLYWLLYGQTGKEVLKLPAKQLVAETVGTFLFLGYLVVAVLVLLNALIGMLSNTYNLTEEHADREWKFHRAAVWAAYLRPVETLPPPFNLIPSIAHLYRCSGTFIRITCGYAKGKVYQKDLHSKNELEDYKRVLKLVNSRYIQANLSTESHNSEGVRPRDLQTLRNDILAFKYGVEDRLSRLTTTLDTSNDKSSRIHHKVEELEPVKVRTSGLVQESATLTDHLTSLHQDADDVQKKQDAELRYAKTHATALQWRIGMLMSQIVKLKDEHSAEIGLRLAQIEMLQNKIVRLEENKEALSENIERGLAQIAKLEDSLLGSEEENRILSEDFKNKVAEVESLKVMVQGLENDKEALSTKLEEKVREVDELQGIVSGLKEDNSALSETLRRMGHDPTQLPKKGGEDKDQVGFVLKTVRNFENLK